MATGKIVKSKLPDNRFTIPTANGPYTIQFKDHLAVVPDDVAITATAMSDFCRIVKDVWNYPLRKILLMRESGLGDVLLTTPIIRKFAELGIDVDFACKNIYKDLFINNPYVCTVLDYNTVIRDREYYDAVIDLQWVAELAEGNGCKDHRTKIFADYCEIKVNDFRIDYYCTDLEINSMAFHIKARRPVAYVLSTSNTSGSNRNWTWDQHRECLTLLVHKGYTPILLSDNPQVITLDKVLNFTGCLTIREAAAVIAIAEFIVTPDTGLFHLAQALNKKIYTYFGAFPLISRQTSKNVVQLNVDNKCPLVNCYDYGCKFGFPVCLQSDLSLIK